MGKVNEVIDHEASLLNLQRVKKHRFLSRLKARVHDNNNSYYERGYNVYQRKLRMYSLSKKGAKQPRIARVGTYDEKIMNLVTGIIA